MITLIWTCDKFITFVLLHDFVNGVNAGVQYYYVEDMPGVIAPMGFWDPLGFSYRADEDTIARYREAEIIHGRVAMLAVVGILVGEMVAQSKGCKIHGPAITHLTQVSRGFWPVIIAFIGAAEVTRAEIGWEDPADCPVDQPGLLRQDYLPGDLGFDPLNLAPIDDDEFWWMQTKELSHGRLAMIAVTGFVAQELVDGKGIVQHWQSMK